MADDEMVAWLEATLDAIEYAATEAVRAAGATWQQEGHEVMGVDTGHRVVADAYGNAGMSDSDMAHIALHDPRAVLARVEAERAMLRQYADVVEAANRAFDGEDERDSFDVQFEVRVTGRSVTDLRLVLGLLAYGHRYDAPGYRPEWTPA